MNGSRQPEKGIRVRTSAVDIDQLTATVQRCWEEVLGPVAAGTSVHFMACGGDSLRAVELSQRLAYALGYTVSPGWLLANPDLDIERLSATLAECQVADAPHSDLRNSKTPATAALPSFSQERMWFMHQLAPAGLAYNVSQALRLTGAVNVEALETAVRAVVLRHALLRSRFNETPDGLRWAVTYDSLEAALERIEVNAAPGEGSAADRLKEASARLVQVPFDLARGPVFRAALVRADDEDSVLLLWAHHIVADQWAFDILVREIAEAYNVLYSERPVQLPAPTSDFGHYAAWHRDWFQKERLQTELSYWRRQLRGLEPLVLTADHPRPPEQSFRGRRLHRPLSTNLRDRLQQFAAEQGATLAMLLLTALKVLLHGHTGRSDIAVGVPVANRQHPGANQLVGTLVNTLVVRSDLSTCDNTLDVLALVRRNMLDALEHQDLPFEQLVKTLELPRDASASPLFTVMFNMLNTPLGKVRFQGLEWSRFEFDRQAAQFDLTVTVDAEFDRSIVFEYATDLFDHDTIERIATRYFHLLQCLAEQPRQGLDESMYLPPSERAQLESFERGPSRATAADTVVELLEKALKQDDGSHLEWPGGRLSTATLERRSRGIALALQARGIGRGHKVGFCLPRTPAMLIALVGILRSGAAYVPLDPGYPEERLRFMAKDAGLSALVGDTQTAPLGCWPAVPRLILEPCGELAAEGLETTAAADWPELARPSVRGDDPAYVIYTSGSTGQPKGVVVPHAGVVNFLLSMAEAPGLEAHDRLLAVTTPSFDIAVLELLLPLITGATIVLAPQEILNDGEALAATLTRQHITVMQATPSTWRLMLDAGWQGLSSLKAMVGGEALSSTLADALSSRTAEAWNMYGPTETTVWSAVWRMPKSEMPRVVLGKPIANTVIRVLDTRSRRCPIGVPGEICIGGAGLAREYLGRSALTAERFIPDPFDATGRGRLYRTGDLGRWLADGTLEHLGRMDTQVKLRGHRIELGEIEHRLESHPEVAGAVAHVIAADGPDARLVAYLVPWGKMPQAKALREYLRGTLPEYMLPQHYVELDAIPLLPNGKVDRNNLPAATAERIADSQLAAGTDPVTPLQRCLAQLWSEVLGIGRVGLHQRFFELGGHSMLAVRVVHRIRETVGYRCSVADLFRNDTVATLAEALGASVLPSEDCAIALQPLGDLLPLFCLTGVPVYRELAARLGTERPVIAQTLAVEAVFAEAQASGKLSPPATIEALAAGHLRLIRQRQPTGPYHLLGFSMGGAVALEVAHLLRQAGEQVALLVMIDTDLPGGAQSRLGWRLRYWLGQARLGQEPPVNPYVAAIAAYRGSHFNGPALFFEARRAHRPAGRGWEALAPSIRTLRVDAEHDALLNPPAVDELAQVLKEALSTSTEHDANHSGVRGNAS